MKNMEMLLMEFVLILVQLLVDQFKCMQIQMLLLKCVFTNVQMVFIVTLILKNVLIYVHKFQAVLI